MPKQTARPYALETREALKLLGQIVRTSRIGRKETAAQLAERGGISRGLLQRIERGDPGCSVGAVFEIAALVGFRLFDLDRQALSANSQILAHMLTLLPQAARPTRKSSKDDF